MAKKRPTYVVDDVWCITCQHIHIPRIPAVTFVCSDCGFGVWADQIAASHATSYPHHIVYPVFHMTMELPRKTS